MRRSLSSIATSVRACETAKIQARATPFSCTPPTPAVAGLSMNVELIAAAETCYLNTMSNMRVLLVGPYPPPYGGLAVQIYEWRRYLSGLGTCECAILNIGESRSADIAECIPVRGAWDFAGKVYRYVRRGYLVHLVTNGHNLKSWLCSFVCALAGAGHGRRTVLVFGSGHAPDYIDNAGLAVRLLIRAAIAFGGRLICRNERTRRSLVSAGADPRKIVILSGFLGVHARAAAPIPQAIEAFLSAHSPVLGATAGADPEYGVPLMLEGLGELRKVYPRIGLVVMGPGPEACARFSGTRRVPDHVCLTGPLPHDVALEIMRRLTAFLRPTYFDGDSNSVREALALGVPVVASDTDFRPEGVVQFRRGDVQDLVGRVRETLARARDRTNEKRGGVESDSAARLVSLYRELSRSTE